MSSTTDTHNAATTTIKQSLDGDITPEQAKGRIERAKRLTQCARYGVPVKSLQDTDLKKWCKRLGVEL